MRNLKVGSVGSARNFFLHFSWDTINKNSQPKAIREPQNKHKKYAKKSQVMVGSTALPYSAQPIFWLQTLETLSYILHVTSL
jgi:hypothetical protein